MSGFRSGKQCRTRWLNHLDPGIKREPWSEREARRLSRSIAGPQTLAEKPQQETRKRDLLPDELYETLTEIECVCVCRGGDGDLRRAAAPGHLCDVQRQFAILVGF